MKKLFLVIINIFLLSSLSQAATVVVNPKFSAWDDSGDPLAGGKLYSYVCGDVTEKATCADITCSSNNSNPVILDTRGEADVFGEGCYKLVLKTSAGVTIWTRDDIRGIGSTTNTKSLDQDYGCNLDTALDSISTTKTTLEVDCACTLTESETIPSTLEMVFARGGKFTMGAYNIDFSASQPQAGQFQIFNYNSTGTVTGLTEVYPKWWGAAVDNATDDSAEWQDAFDAFPTTGGKFHIPDGVSLIAASIIWPHSATDCYSIWVDGINAIMRPEGVGDANSGASQIHFTGTGPLFEAMGEGGAETLNFNSRLSNFNALGTQLGGIAGTYFLHSYSLIHAQLENIGIKWFDQAIFVDYRMYYCKLERVIAKYNTDGLYVDATGSAMNGVLIDKCQFSYNERYGIYALYAGKDVTISSTYIEKNKNYGIRMSNFESLNIVNCYIEENVITTGNSEIYLAGSPYYDSNLLLSGNLFYDDDSTYAVTLNGIPNLTAINNDFNIGGTVAIDVDGNLIPAGTLSGNKSPRIDGYSLMQQSFMDRFTTSDSFFPGIFGAKRPPTYAQMQKGDYFFNNMSNTTGSDNGGAVGWRVSVPGAGSSVADPTVTATTGAASPTVELSASNSEIYRGTYIKIAGETFGTGTSAYVRVIDTPTATSLTLAENANVGVAGAAITFNDAEFENIYGAQLYRSLTTLDRAEAGTTDFLDIDIPANFMGTKGGFRVHAWGSKPDTTVGTFIEFYLNSTNIANLNASNNAYSWDITIDVYNNVATNAQKIHTISVSNSVPTYADYTAAIDTTAKMDVFLRATIGTSGKIRLLGLTVDAI